MQKRFCGLIIMDGFALGEDGNGNAINMSKIEYLPNLFKTRPCTLLGASGLDVGLPDGQMGNSEVGHQNMGAGSIVYQELTRITKSINDGDFFKNEALLNAMKKAKENNKNLHIMGLLSDGGVHSHIEHLKAIIKMAKMNGLEKVYVHCFMDGRDVSPTSGEGFIKQLEDYLAKEQIGKIATVMGRYYAMDRDNRWDRVEKAYNALTLGNGKIFKSALDAVIDSYKNDKTDEFIEPSVICNDSIPVALVQKGDSIVFYNFRPDRAREITRAFISEDFQGFVRKSGYLNPVYVSMTQYDASFKNLDIAFKPEKRELNFGKYISNLGLNQLRIAETEKYAHVTFFFNGGVEEPYKNEDRILINSPKVATYDLQPEMSANEVCDKAVEAVLSEKYDVMVLNFANCDMVGHTGNIPATVKAVQTVDACVKRVVEAIQKIGGIAFITADHGNADMMLAKDGSPFTAHTTNPVPFVIVDDKVDYKLEKGVLADIAPTILSAMGYEIPKEMQGKSLIVK